MKFKFNDNICKCIIIVVLSVIVGCMLYKQSKAVTRENMTFYNKDAGQAHIVVMQQKKGSSSDKQYYIFAIAVDGGGSYKLTDKDSGGGKISEAAIGTGTLFFDPLIANSTPSTAGTDLIDNTSKWSNTLQIFPTEDNSSKWLYSDNWYLMVIPTYDDSGVGVPTITKMTGLATATTPQLLTTDAAAAKFDPHSNNFLMKTGTEYYQLVANSDKSICYLFGVAIGKAGPPAVGADPASVITLPTLLTSIPSVGNIHTASKAAIIMVDIKLHTTIEIAKSILIMNGDENNMTVIIIFKDAGGEIVGYVDRTLNTTSSPTGSIKKWYPNKVVTAVMKVNTKDKGSAESFAKSGLTNIADMWIESSSDGSGSIITLLNKH